MLKKRFTAVLTAAVSLICCFFAAACKKLPEEEEKAEPYPENFMCGYFLTFYDGETALTGENFKSGNAVKNYFYKHKFSGGYTTYTINGLPVSEGTIAVEGSPLSPDKSGKVTLTDKIYFTRELSDKTVKFSVVYYDYALGEVYTEHVAASNFLGPMTQFFGNVMNATVETETGFEKITYELDGSVTFIKTDKLIEVKFLEFNGSNECFFRTSEYAAFDSFSCQEETEYVIVEKKYETDNGAERTERSVYSRGTEVSERVYFPYGNGLTKPADIKINFKQKEG